MKREIHVAYLSAQTNFFSSAYILYIYKHYMYMYKYIEILPMSPSTLFDRPSNLFIRCGVAVEIKWSREMKAKIKSFDRARKYFFFPTRNRFYLVIYIFTVYSTMYFCLFIFFIFHSQLLFERIYQSFLLEHYLSVWVCLFAE